MNGPHNNLFKWKIHFSGELLDHLRIIRRLHARISTELIDLVHGSFTDKICILLFYIFHDRFQNKRIGTCEGETAFFYNCF